MHRGNDRCILKADNLCDDLGKVDMLFTTTTGALTRNECRLVVCSIRDTVFGEAVPDSSPDYESEARKKSFSSVFSDRSRVLDVAQ